MPTHWMPSSIILSERHILGRIVSKSLDSIETSLQKPGKTNSLVHTLGQSEWKYHVLTWILDQIAHLCRNGLRKDFHPRLTLAYRPSPNPPSGDHR